MVAVKTLLRKYDVELRMFRRRLFSLEVDSSAWVASGGAGEVIPQMAHFGPVPSTTNRHAVLTVMGDMIDQSVILQDESATGTVLTLSVAAHHRMLRNRLSVDRDDAVVWVRAILGDEWTQHAYAAGAHSTVREENNPRPARMTTEYFHVFLDATGEPEPAPPSFPVAVEPLIEVRSE